MDQPRTELPLPEALPYETPSRPDSDLFWSAFRWAIVVWSMSVLIRHTLYWGCTFLGVVGFGGVSPVVPSFFFALIECVILAIVLTNAVKLRPGDRNHHASLAGLCTAYIAASMAGFVVDNFGTLFSITRGPLYTLAVLWRLVSRLQLLVVPALAIVVISRWRRIR